jgi:hypothetical protein
MSIHLHTLSNQIGVFTQSQDRFLTIAKALNEPCVWLNQAKEGDARNNYEVVIIDSHTPSPVERRARVREEAGEAAHEAAAKTEDSAGRRQPGLVVYQCPDGMD